MSRTKRLALLAVAFLAMAIGFTPMRAQGAYNPVVLSSAPGDIANAINNPGYSAGTSVNGDSNQATWWDPSASPTRTTLSSGGGSDSKVWALNAIGEAVGEIDSAMGIPQPTMWSTSGVPTTLYNGTGAATSENLATPSLIVGWSMVGGIPKPFLRDGMGAIHWLSTTAYGGKANIVCDSNVVGGETWLSANKFVASAWGPDYLRTDFTGRLPTPYSSRFTGMCKWFDGLATWTIGCGVSSQNDSNPTNGKGSSDIISWVINTAGSAQAVPISALHMGGQMYVKYISNSGTIVGQERMPDGTTYGWVAQYSPTANPIMAHDLTSLCYWGIVTDARSVNESGQIVGTIKTRLTSPEKNVRLDPK